MKIEVYVRELNNKTFNNLMFFYIFVFDKTLQSHLKRTYVGSIEDGDSLIQVNGCFEDEDMCFYKEALKPYTLIHEKHVDNFRESNISDLFAELMPERFV